MIPGKTYTPEDVLRATLRRRWWIAVPFLTILAASTVYSLSLPKRYRSETLILVVPQRIPESYVRSTVTTPIEDRLRSINEQILSRSRLEQIIREHGLYVGLREVRPMEEVVAVMREDVVVTPVRGDSFRVTYSAGDPVVAMKVTQRLASMYIDENVRDREVQAESTNQFIETQLEKAKSRLLEHEQRLEKYRREFAGELPSQSQANLAAIMNSRQQLQQLAESVTSDRDRRLLLEKQITDLEAGGPVVDPAKPAGEASVEQRLEAARENLRTLLLRLKFDHPDVTAARRVVATLQRELESAPVEAPAISPASGEVARRTRMRQLQTEIQVIDRGIATKEADAAKLRLQIDEYQRRVDAVPTRETEMTELMRDYTTLQDVYVGLLEKNESSKIAANLERAQAGEQFKILDPASVAEQPYSPDHGRIIGLGAALGLAIGFGFALLLEIRDTTLRNEEEVVRLLALPVLALVPFVQSPLERRRSRRRIVAAAAVLMLIAAVTVAAAWRLGKLG